MAYGTRVLSHSRKLRFFPDNSERRFETSVIINYHKFTPAMFSTKKTEQEKQTSSRLDVFIEEIKKDMTNRAAIAAKQESTIKKLVEELEADRKELKQMRILYETRMKMDDEIIEKCIRSLERKKQ